MLASPSAHQHWGFEEIVSHRGRGRDQRVLLTALGWQRYDTGARQEAPVHPVSPWHAAPWRLATRWPTLTDIGIENQPRPLVIQASKPRRRMCW